MRCRRQDKPFIPYVDVPAHKEYALVTFIYHYKYLLVPLRPRRITQQPRRSPLKTDSYIFFAKPKVASEQESNETFDDDDYEDGWEKHEILQEKKVIPVFEIGPDQAACAPKIERQTCVDEAFKPDPRFPIYSAAGLQVLREVKSGCSPVCKVRAIGNGEIMMSKTPQKGFGCHELKREMAALVTIRDTEERVKIKIAIPRLLGYVAHAETGVIIGFLREWVESQKWADQIEETMSDLHDIGLFWGDYNPANVIVDEKQNLWLISLGGSFTHLWVDKELTGTLEGDGQGLLNIQKFLGVVERDGKNIWGHHHHF